MTKKSTLGIIPFFLLILLAPFTGRLNAQSGTEFWLAPPDITDLHNAPGGEPLYCLVSSTGLASVVTIDQPANPGFTPIVVNVQANKSIRVNLTAFKTQLETRPTNTIVNTGLRITATTSITCSYQCANTNNTDIWALKGPNGLGTEFYIPLHKHAPFNNEASFAAPDQAFASFDICATQNGTTVTIYSPTPVDGHPALSQFNITLNRGQTYSCGWTGANWSQPSTHPSGAVVLADKPITVSIKDDSNHNPSGGCYDIIGDQIVPTDVVGEDYIAVKGSLNATGDESVVLMATQNNTKVYVDGSTLPIATLFAGEYFRIDMDSLSTSVNNALYIHCTGPTYAMHITGFGCEMGMAILPPLNCAGSQQLNFVRDNSQTFYLTVLCRAAATGGFTITGPGTATINPASFVTVPGTAGIWKAARITYNTTEVPVDSTFKITNSIDVFALGLGNGGATSGCKYGYFSEFVAPITSNAGLDQTICANTTAALTGVVAGGTITGIWTTSGTGTFTPSNTSLTATYTPSAGDAALGSVTITLTSTGACTPISDAMLLTITPAPTANAGTDQTKCKNNANISLTAAVTVATGGVWTGGAGTFLPGNNVLNPLYIPTVAEINAGSVALTLTTTGNGICNPVSDNILITFTPSPVVNAGTDQTRCGNNAAISLSGSITVATGGVWTGGGGSFVPSATSLNPVYTPTPSEISAGSVTLTLTSTGNGTCNAVSDQVTLFFSAPPVANAGPDQTKCANNSVITLAGSVTVSTGGQWSGGLGVFTPNNNFLSASYAPTSSEIASGSVTLTLSTTGNGTCNPATDQVTISFTPAPTADAGTNQTTCANNALVTLNGAFTIASGATWSGGLGTFSPNNTTMNATYTPSSTEINAGGVTLTLTTTGNGTCTAVSDQVLITITDSPLVNAGPDQTRCSNNAATSLSGNITVASGGIWTGGAGTFNPSASSLNAVYTPAGAEIANGSVTLTLTSTGNNGCIAVSDQVTIFFSAPPTASAGQDQTKCGNNAVTTLAGNVTVAGGGQWTGGLGIFSPDNATMNATYTPTVSEIASGSVTLTLTTTSNAGCTPVTDQMIISFTPAPTVSAGTDIIVCANNANATLSGSFTVAGGIVWTGGAGTFVPDNTSINAVYTPTAAEITAGSVILTLTSTGNNNCTAVSDQVLITITPAPIVNAGLNINACSNNASTSLNGQVFNATGGQWSGGGGSFFPNNTVLNATYTPSAAEVSAGSATLTLSSTGNGSCNAVTDEVQIFYSPTPISNAGANQTACGNNATVNLNGFVNFAAGGQWSGGLGLFSPSANALQASYTPTTTEIADGSVQLILNTTGNGSCIAVSDTLTVTYTAIPTADAGSPLTSCANNAGVELNGGFTIASGAVWSGGTGSFSPNSAAMNATYTPSASEITAGSATLILTTTGNGTCLPVTDNILITITPAPAVNAGADQVTCINNVNVGLSGSVSGPTNTGAWISSGSGTFVPNNTTLNATYQSSVADVAAGSVVLTLTSTGNGSCTAVNDQMTITILPAGTSNAGNDVTVCANNSSSPLNGSVGGGAASGTWGTSGTGIFLPNNASLNATYIPSSFDIANGGATVFLTANSCNVATDSLQINITPAPVVSTGPDQTLCSSESTATLNGTISGATTTGIWTTNGTGTLSPSNTALAPTYTISAGDIVTQNIYFILTSTGNGACVPVSDTTWVHVYPAGTSAAGPDQTVCANNNSVMINGNLGGGATQGLWSTTGSGTFSPSNTSLSATYTPSTADITAGSVSLALTATNSCNSAVDFLNVTITPAPTVNAGAEMTSCANNPGVELDGSFTVATGATWSGGAGAFSPNNTTVDATYTPSVSEILAGMATLYLTSNGNGTCLAVTDSMSISITPSPIVNAGSDQLTCITDLSIALNGSVSTGTGQWTTSGNGNFTPSNTALNAVYELSTADSLAGGVVLTLISTNNISCNAVSDQVSISIVPAGTASAGNDVTVCGNNSNVSLHGIVGGGATAGTWSTTGTGSFVPNNTSLDATYFPSAFDVASGTVTISLTANTCSSTVDALDITITPAPEVNAGNDQTICESLTTAVLNGSVTGGSTSGIWTTNGTGTFSPSNTALDATYNVSAADANAQNIYFALTSTSNGLCTPVADTVLLNIYPAGTADAGDDQVLCMNNANAVLNGTLGGGATQGQWSTSGTGIFVPNSTTPNATYVPGAADLLAGTVGLLFTATNSCNGAVDFMNIMFTPAPVVDAGPSQSTCGSNPQIVLNGSVANATGAIWTGGNGNFVPNSSVLNATYSPSLSEQSQGFVTLTLTSTGNGNCSAVSDTVTFNLSPGIVTNAGVDQEVCVSAPFTQLQGIVSQGSTTGTWTTLGSGAFTPSSAALNALYTFSEADVAAESITLILTSTNNGVCPADRDTVMITFGASAFASAGADQSICASSSEISLNGFVAGGSTSGTWTTTGNGDFTPDANTLQASYALTPSDIAAGMLTFVLTSTENGSCLAGVDTLVYTIDPISTANAGGDVSVCADDMEITLGGNIGGASSTGIWSTMGSGTFVPDNSVLNAVYQPSASDALSGSVTLVLIATNTSACIPATDSITVSITQPPIASAGNDQSICASSNEINLNGLISGGSTTGAWTTTGNGSFSPDANTLNATYTIVASDIVTGELTFVLATTGNGSCAAATDTMVVSLSAASVVNAGSNVNICSDDLTVPLGGNVSGPSTTGIWTTLGSGVFSPDNTTLNATYTPGANDALTGGVMLVLTSTNTGFCAAVSDTMSVIISSPSIANAGVDQTQCALDAVVALNGSVTGESSTGTWSSTGTGTFSPDNTSLNATYTPSNADAVNGSVSLMLTTSGNGTCTPSSDVILITLQPAAIVSAGPDRVLCGNFSGAPLGGIISGSSTTGTWTTSGSGTFDPGVNTPGAVYTLSNADIIAESVMLVLTSTNNGFCPSISDTMMITVEPEPIAAFSTVSDDFLGVQFTDESIGAAAWYWNFGIGGTSTMQDPEFVYPEIGSYPVTLVITSAGGCTDTVSTLVNALEPIGTPVAIPTGFSPNNDNSNDVLHVLGGPFKEVDFRIYNEWGNLVFSTIDPNVGWDGTYKGKEQPGGVYIYTAVGTTVKGRFVKLSGNVTLIR